VSGTRCTAEEAFKLHLMFLMMGLLIIAVITPAFTQPTFSMYDQGVFVLYPLTLLVMTRGMEATWRGLEPDQMPRKRTALLALLRTLGGTVSVYLMLLAVGSAFFEALHGVPGLKVPLALLLAWAQQALPFSIAYLKWRRRQ